MITEKREQKCRKTGVDVENYTKKSQNVLYRT